jgi:hypothetical protein
MSSLTKPLQKRIQELKSSIESQKAELAAYERVLEIEIANATPQVGLTEIADIRSELQLQRRGSLPQTKQQPVRPGSHVNPGLTGSQSS